MPFLSRWNWKKDDGWKDGRWHTTDKGAGPFGHVTHIFSRGAKIAYQYWLKYEYTLDKDWLNDRAYPMLKGVAEFYRNFPNLKKDKDGKYHIYYVNDNESVLGAHNTIEEIASMMGIFPVAIKASEILNVDNELRKLWKDVLENLSPLPLSSDYPELLPDKPITWTRALPPVTQGNGNRLPDPNTLPVWFFDLCTLESNSDMLKTANATFDAYFPNGIDENAEVNVLSKLPVA
ncbi:MAG: glycoside hydrolase, partial [Marivirga sp.]|nr:glycoside hydrolase [Marivirga sp.]